MLFNMQIYKKVTLKTPDMVTKPQKIVSLQNYV